MLHMHSVYKRMNEKATTALKVHYWIAQFSRILLRTAPSKCSHFGFREPICIDAISLFMQHFSLFRSLCCQAETYQYTNDMTQALHLSRRITLSLSVPLTLKPSILFFLPIIQVVDKKFIWHPFDKKTNSPRHRLIGSYTCVQCSVDRHIIE